MADFDTTALLADIRVRGQIPTYGDWTDDALLLLATAEMRTYVAPLLISHQDSYFNERATTPLVANQSIYRIPSAAVGGKLVGVYLQYTGQQSFPLNQTTEHRLLDRSLKGQPEAFYFYDSSNIALVPVPTSTTGTLIFKYNRRTATLVTPAVGGSTSRTVTNVLSVGGGVYEFNPALLGILDCIKGSPNFENIGSSVSVTVGTTLASRVTLSSGVLEVGDIFPQVGVSWLVQLPPEYFYLLSQQCACKYLEDIGSTEELQTSMSIRKVMQDQLTPSATPRSDESPKKFKNRKFFGGW
jgi:hypothetical protein